MISLKWSKVALCRFIWRQPNDVPLTCPGPWGFQCGQPVPRGLDSYGPSRESHGKPWMTLRAAIQRFLEAPMAFVSTWCAGKICVVKWYNPDHACLISYFWFELAEFLVGSDTCSLLPADQRLREVQCRWSGRARISGSSSRDQRFWLISPDFTSHHVLFGANSVQTQLRWVFWCFRYWLVKMPSLGLTHVP